MKIRIHPLTALLITICFLMGQIKLLLAAYIVMTLHEAAHLAAAVCIGLKPESITFAPFGVQLRLKSRMICSAADEVILYAAGPLVNGALALAALIFGYEQLYRLNISLFIMNLLPVIPLDGGMILRRLLMCRIGSEAAQNTMRAVTALFVLAFAAASAALWYTGGAGVTAAIMTLFLIGNMLTSGEKYSTEFIFAVSGAAKRTNRVKIVLVDEKHSYAKAARSITPSCTTLAAIAENGELKELVSETQILERVSGIDKLTENKG